MNALLEVRNLKVYFPVKSGLFSRAHEFVKAVDDVSFSLEPGETLGLVGDLLYTFGWALWTGVVVVVFLQIIPEAKRRQYKRALDAYEAALRNEAGARSDDASPDR